MQLGDNVKAEVKGKMLTIQVDLSTNAGLSKSGKSMVVASTRGNATIAGPNGEQIKLGLNVYKPTS